jgi:polyisoprenoid-binding protein YceI
MATSTWTIDPAHSDIGFKVKHLMITSVKGKFEKFDATATAEDDDFTHAQVTVTLDASSIHTGVGDRDAHLRSEDFFNTGMYPQIRFVSTGITRKGDDYTLTGDLTIRDITKPITLDVEFGGIVKDPYGQTKAGFTVEGKLSRKEYGLLWNAMTEAGGMVVADEIKILCDVQFIKQAS